MPLGLLQIEVAALGSTVATQEVEVALNISHMSLKIVSPAADFDCTNRPNPAPDEQGKCTSQ